MLPRKMYNAVMPEKRIGQTPQAEPLPREEHLRLLVESATDFAMLSLDTNGCYDTWNTGAERILGYTRKEVLGQYSALIFTPEDREKGEPEKEMQTALWEGRAEDERWHLKKDGSRFFASGVMTPLRDENGTHVGYAKIMRDLTGSHRAEAALRESENRFRTLSDTVPQVIWTNAADGTANYFNQRWYEYSGLSYEESVGLGWQAIVHPDDAPASVERWQKALAKGDVFDTEYRLRSRDGLYCWFIGRNVPLRDGEGRVTGWFGSATDIQELRELREDLEARVAERTAELSAAFAERRALMARVVRAQEEERQRISRELHDSTGQYMTALSLELGSIERTAASVRETAMQAARAASAAARVASDAAHIAEEAADKAVQIGASAEAGRLAGVASEAARTAAIAGTDAGAAAAAANAAVAIVDQSAPQVARLRELTASLSRDMHSLAVGLRPTSLDDLGLVPALTALCEDWARRSGVAIDFEQAGMRAGRLAPEVETTVFRVVQEALTNAARYAVPSGATAISVTLQRFDSLVQAIIEDSGSGFDVEEATRKGRLGLSGMRERAELAGGTLEIESSRGSGTTVYLRIPI